MVNQELLSYVKEQKEKGYTADAIITALRSRGWSQEDITQVIESTYTSSQNLNSFPGIKIVIVTVVISCLLIVGLMAYFFLQHSFTNHSSNIHTSVPGSKQPENTPTLQPQTFGRKPIKNICDTYPYQDDVNQCYQQAYDSCKDIENDTPYGSLTTIHIEEFCTPDKKHKILLSFVRTTDPSLGYPMNEEMTCDFNNADELPGYINLFADPKGNNCQGPLADFIVPTVSITPDPVVNPYLQSYIDHVTSNFNNFKKQHGRFPKTSTEIIPLENGEHSNYFETAYLSDGQQAQLIIYYLDNASSNVNLWCWESATNKTYRIKDITYCKLPGN